MPQYVISQCTDGTESSTSLPNCLPMSDITWGHTVGAFSLGGLVGGLATNFLNDYFGRRMNMIIAAFWNIIGGILSATSVSVEMYAVGRAFVGIAAGISGASVAIYVSEISTNRCRGAFGAFFGIFLNVSILISQLCGRYMSFTYVWRFLWAIPAIIALIQIGLVFTIVETPRRLCATKQNDKARAALAKLRNYGDIEEEFEAIVESRRQELNMKMVSMWDIVSIQSRRMSWNAFVVIVIQMYNQVGGIGPMSVYSVGFLAKAFGGDTVLATNVVLAQAGANIVATLIAVFLIGWMGRKGCMLLSTMGMTIGSVFIVIASALEDPGRLGPLVITGAILFSFTYCLGCAIIPWLIAPELLPLQALPAGAAMGNASNWLFNYLINTLWPMIDRDFGNYSFVLFAGINFGGFIFMLLFMPETTGKGIDDHDAASTKGPAVDNEAMSVDSIRQDEKIEL
ncbi:general substrate transporter [Zychaea mexicana]|uniref:general substrate transporter n=1 Tax=Zychaea mexicana TaxID=64656 RepID=UPI0022FE3D4D|nr:general substrate transporter [Zychaea mexicana]KAI9492226.1 general substrate transporter [Zychaea mexicana]